MQTNAKSRNVMKYAAAAASTPSSAKKSPINKGVAQGVGMALFNMVVIAVYSNPISRGYKIDPGMPKSAIPVVNKLFAASHIGSPK